MRGVYVLLMNLKRPSTIRIGSLGRLRFSAGVYVYVGSALNSLEPRIMRHLSKDKNIHWHIDRLTTSPHASIQHIAVAETERRVECKISRRIASLPSSTGIRGFGSSDCCCHSHLYRLDPQVGDSLDAVKEVFSSLNLDPTVSAVES